MQIERESNKTKYDIDTVILIRDSFVNDLINYIYLIQNLFVLVECVSFINQIDVTLTPTRTIQ